MKRALSIALRLLLTAAFIALALRMVRFGDAVRVTPPDGPSFRALSVEGTSARLEDGTLRSWPPGTVLKVEPEPGFLTVARRARPLALAGLAVLLVIPILLTAVRWRLLLSANGFDVPLGRVFVVNYAGAFFNTFLPGAVGGDIAKAVIAGREQDRKAALVGTILLDRLVGLAAMILMAAVAVLPFATDPAMRTPVLLVGALLAGLLLGAALYANPRLRASAPARWAAARLPFERVVRELDGVFLSAWRNRGASAKALGVSLLSQAMLIGVIYLMSRSIGVEGATLGQFFLFEPVIFIITAVPLSVGGWGVQESAYALLFGLAGVPANEAVALSLVYKVGLLIVSLPGGILAFWRRSR